MEVIHIRPASRSRQAPDSDLKEHDYEEGHSIDKHIENEEGKTEEIVIDKERPSTNAGTTTDSITDVISKGKNKVMSSIEEVYSYVRSLSGLSMDNLNQPAVSTIGELEEDMEPDEEVSVKKWVVYDMVKLGFGEEQIKEAIEYMESLPEDMTREDMLRRVAEHFVESKQSLEEVVEEWQNTQRKEEDVQEKEDSVVIEVNKEKVEEEKVEVPVVKDAVVIEIKKAPVQMTVTCQVCFDSFPSDEVKKKLKCSHRFCERCYSLYILQLIQSNRLADITCPYVGCPERFNDEQVLSLLDAEQGERFSRLRRVALLNLNPHLRWCIRPGCDKFVVGNGKKRKLVCACKAQICFKCGNQYHMRPSCNAAVDKVYKQYANEKHVQKCPQCKSRVEKNGGCHHMTCARCTYQWCWLCEKKYTFDHYEQSNPASCPKLKKQMIQDGRQAPEERLTYWSDICKDPFRIIALPLFLIIVSAMLPQHLYASYMTNKQRREYKISQAGGGVVFFFILLGIALLPLSVGYVAFCVIVDGIIDFILWICKKAVNKDYTHKFPRSLMPHVF